MNKETEKIIEEQLLPVVARQYANCADYNSLHQQKDLRQTFELLKAAIDKHYEYPSPLDGANGLAFRFAAQFLGIQLDIPNANIEKMIDRAFEMAKSFYLSKEKIHNAIE